MTTPNDSQPSPEEGKPRPQPRRAPRRASKAQRALHRLRQQSGDGKPLMAQLKNRFPGNPKKQVMEFYKNFDMQALTGLRRSVGIRTKQAHSEVMLMALDVLKELNMSLQNVDELGPKHVDALAKVWEARELEPATLQFYMTALRRCTTLQGKPDAAPRLEVLVVDPASAHRSYVPVKAKTATAAGVAMEVVLRKIAEKCQVTEMHIRMIEHFGLRVQEVLMMRPHESDRGAVLMVYRGSKGGRLRYVPIRNAEQRRVLDLFKAMPSNSKGEVVYSDQPTKLHQAKAHLYGVMRAVGMTKSQSGITAHGLRHEYANARYKEITGFDSPVHGGLDIDPKLDLHARQLIAEELGHGRPWVTTAYTSSIARMRRHYKQALQAARLAVSRIRAQLEAAGLTSLWLLDDAACGKVKAEVQLRVAFVAGAGESGSLSEATAASLLKQVLGCGDVQFVPWGDVPNDTRVFQVL